MPTENAAATEDSLDVITDALLTASRLLVAISARSIAHVDETITIPQFRTLVILANHGPMNLATLAGALSTVEQEHLKPLEPAVKAINAQFNTILSAFPGIGDVRHRLSSV